MKNNHTKREGTFVWYNNSLRKITILDKRSKEVVLTCPHYERRNPVIKLDEITLARPTDPIRFSKMSEHYHLNVDNMHISDFKFKVSPKDDVEISIPKDGLDPKQGTGREVPIKRMWVSHFDVELLEGFKVSTEHRGDLYTQAAYAEKFGKTPASVNKELKKGAKSKFDLMHINGATLIKTDSGKSGATLEINGFKANGQPFRHTQAFNDAIHNIVLRVKDRPHYNWMGGEITSVYIYIGFLPNYKYEIDPGAFNALLDLSIADLLG